MEIRVRVIDQNGAPVADAKVEASARGGSFVDSYSDEAGVLTFSYNTEDYGDTCKICVSKHEFQDNEKIHHIQSEALSEFTITLLPKNGPPPPKPDSLKPDPPKPTPPRPTPPRPISSKTNPQPHRPIPWIIIIVLLAVCVITGVIGGAAWWFVSEMKVRVPQLVGKNIEEALHLLTQSDLAPEQTAPALVAADKPANQVVSQDPAADQLVERRSHVRLTVGIPKTKVPPLVGKNIEEAIRLLNQSHLVASQTKTISPDKPPKQVVSQDPAPNQRVDPGSTVKLTVSASPPESYPGEKFPQTRLRALTEADVAGWSYAQLRYAINELYARHGATFSDRYEEIENEFRGFSWYKPVPNRTLSQIEASFPEIELHNAKLLARLRDQKHQ